MILYRGIYGIGGIPDIYDMSMAFKTTLTKEDYKKHYEDIVDKIKRFAINDFNFDVPRVTEYKFEFISDLVNEYDEIIRLIRILENNFFSLTEYTRDLNDIYIISNLEINICHWQISKIKIILWHFMMKFYFFYNLLHI